MVEYNKFKSYYAVIMSGGRGERFWPLSTPKKPKPFLQLFDKKSLLQLTYERINKFFYKENIFLILSAEHLEVAKKQLKDVPEENFIIEPVGRDTTAACCYASYYISKIYQNPDVIIFPSDHYIQKDKEFYYCLDISAEILKSKDSIVIFGIKPTRADINYGYIEVDENKLSDTKKGVFFAVKKFKEKPNRELAEDYLQKGNYYWNSGIFAWRYGTLLKLIKLHLPKVYEILMEIDAQWGKKNYSKFLENKYLEFPSLSIDYSLLEKASSIYMIPATFQWDDIGNWSALQRMLKKDSKGNTIFGKAKFYESKKCFISCEGMNVLAIGLENIICVKHRNNLLILNRRYENKLKQYLKLAKEEGSV